MTWTHRACCVCEPEPAVCPDWSACPLPTEGTIDVVIDGVDPQWQYRETIGGPWLLVGPGRFTLHVRWTTPAVSCSPDVDLLSRGWGISDVVDLTAVFEAATRTYALGLQFGVLDNCLACYPTGTFLNPGDALMQLTLRAEQFYPDPVNSNLFQGAMFGIAIAQNAEPVPDCPQLATYTWTLETYEARSMGHPSPLPTPGTIETFAATWSA